MVTLWAWAAPIAHEAENQNQGKLFNPKDHSFFLNFQKFAIKAVIRKW
jgi:hypothetical protein